MSTEVPAEPMAYSVKEAAKQLGISQSFAYELAASGELPTRKIRTRIVVPADKLRAMLAGDFDES